MRKSTILFTIIALAFALLFTVNTYSNAAGTLQQNTIGNTFNELNTCANDAGKELALLSAISAYRNAARELQQNAMNNTLNDRNTGGNDAGRNLAVDSSNTRLYFDEHPAFSQKDLNDNFLHYTEGDSRADLPQPYSVEEAANAVGVVLDQATNQPIPNATIFVDETALVCTGDDGRFQITNLPNGTYDWRVAAAGYYDSQYLNYSVHWVDGTDIFTFYLSDSATIVQDRYEVCGPSQLGEIVIPPSTGCSS